jgi:hypothetical protein
MKIRVSFGKFWNTAEDMKKYYEVDTVGNIITGAKGNIKGRLAEEIYNFIEDFLGEFRNEVQDGKKIVRRVHSKSADL